MIPSPEGAAHLFGRVCRPSGVFFLLILSYAVGYGISSLRDWTMCKEFFCAIFYFFFL
jgi:hypothetical protein